MTTLSSAAKAVIEASEDAYWSGSDHPEADMVVAALRAAADQLTPYTVSEMEGAAFARNKLLDIARELEGPN